MLRRRTRSRPRGQPPPESSSDEPPIDDFRGPATGSDEIVFWPWSNHQDPMEKMPETITNTDYDRFKTPSPKSSSKLGAPPKVERRPRNDMRHHNLFNYSSDLEIPAEEAQRIRESSRENGSILFEHFNQKYVVQDRISPSNSPALRNARQVLDSPFLGAPLELSSANLAQDEGCAIPQDSTRSEGKTSGCIQTKGSYHRGPHLD